MKEPKESQIYEGNMIVEMKEDISHNENENGTKKHSTNLPIADVKYDTLEEEILNHVANSKAVFKSQQKEEPELTYEEKRAIAENLLKKNHCLFLSKFGHYLKVEYLEYFSKNEDYETVYHINRLQRYFNNTTRRIDVRNKRYEALKVLIEKGEYFSECEMMKRNPLLYEHLVGQYLTEEQKKTRDAINTPANYIDILMETIERNKLQKHLESQKEEENEVQEENDSDDDDKDDNSRDISKTDFNKQINSHWGENLNEIIDKDKGKHKKLSNSKISNQEIQLLRQEFVTNMYESFLDGKDRDFDYRYKSSNIFFTYINNNLYNERVY